MNLKQRKLARFISKIGSCSTCMRQSLEAAIVAWILFVLAVAYYPDTPLQFAIQLMASALSLLWLVHLATYAARVLHKSRETNEQGTTALDVDPQPNALDRRSAFGVLLRAAAIGAASSLPIVLRPTTAFAFCGQCTKNADCGVSPCRCVNTAPVNSGKVCNECKCD